MNAITWIRVGSLEFMGSRTFLAGREPGQLLRIIAVDSPCMMGELQQVGRIDCVGRQSN